MKIIIKNTSKIVEFNSTARIWEGETESGINGGRMIRAGFETL